MPRSRNHRDIPHGSLGLRLTLLVVLEGGLFRRSRPIGRDISCFDGFPSPPTPSLHKEHGDGSYDCQDRDGATDEYGDPEPDGDCAAPRRRRACRAFELAEGTRGCRGRGCAEGIRRRDETGRGGHGVNLCRCYGDRSEHRGDRHGARAGGRLALDGRDDDPRVDLQVDKDARAGPARGALQVAVVEPGELRGLEADGLAAGRTRARLETCPVARRVPLLEVAAVDDPAAPRREAHVPGGDDLRALDAAVGRRSGEQRPRAVDDALPLLRSGLESPLVQERVELTGLAVIEEGYTATSWEVSCRA